MTATPSGLVFVTGMQRSGTTLLEKLLASHPQLSVLSQPFPYLFLEVKRAFLAARDGGPERYPLGHLFGERRYRPEDLGAFLATLRLERSTLRRLFREMERVDGQYTRVDSAALEAVLDRVGAGDFADTLAGLYRGLAHRPHPAAAGGKETTCEEFLPGLLDRGACCALVIRDPRDVLASLNHGAGSVHAGRPKPTLFNLRQWRKSVAFALHLEGHPRFVWLRYEDLVADPLTGLGRLTDILGVGPFAEDAFVDGLRDQRGEPWRGNSSHAATAGVSDASVGVHRRLLPSAVARAVEALCYPELRRLGYPVTLEWEDVPGVVDAFEEPYAIPPDRADDRDTGRAAVAAERRRLALLPEPTTAATRPWFLFGDVHDQLRAAALRS